MSAEAAAKRVFVSHSHADNTFSRKLVKSLTDAGLKVWYDEESLGAGHLAEIIERELGQADTYIIVLSPAALASPWVQDERQAAWDLRREGKLRYFIPVVIEDCELPLLLRGMHRVEFFRETYEDGITHLLKLLDVTLSSPVSRQVPTLWEEEATITAHARGCYCLDGASDGSLLATGSYDKTVVLWDSQTRQKVRTFIGHTQGVDAVAWSPDGSLVASASVDQTVRVWNVSKSACELVIRGHTAPLTSVTWSPDGQWIGSTARDATVRIWSA